MQKLALIYIGIWTISIENVAKDLRSLTEYQNVLNKQGTLADSNYGTTIDDPEEMWSIKPSLTEKMVDILQYVADKEKITTEKIVAHFLKNLIRQSQLVN